MLALASLGLIVCFVAGVIGGTVIGGAVIGRRLATNRRESVLLGLIAVTLGAGAGLVAAGQAIPFLVCSAMAMAMAMGLANNVFARDGEVTVGVTYMTGALVRFGQGVAARLGRRELACAHGYGWLWSALALGAPASGGALYHHVTPRLAAGAGFVVALDPVGRCLAYREAQRRLAQRRCHRCGVGLSVLGVMRGADAHPHDRRLVEVAHFTRRPATPQLARLHDLALG